MIVSQCLSPPPSARLLRLTEKGRPAQERRQLRHRRRRPPLLDELETAKRERVEVEPRHVECVLAARPKVGRVEVESGEHVGARSAGGGFGGRAEDGFVAAVAGASESVCAAFLVGRDDKALQP